MNWKKYPLEKPYPQKKIVLKQFLCYTTFGYVVLSYIRHNRKEEWMYHHDVDVIDEVLYWCEIDAPADAFNK